MTDTPPERPSPEALEAFRLEVRAWLAKNTPPTPDFPLPDSFMEVGTDAQFEYLQAWQRKVYDAGYLGIAWPKAYGGGGKHPAYQGMVNREMGAAGVPFMVNVIGLMLSSGSMPERASLVSATISITFAAWAPPITAVRAVGQLKMKSGDRARLAIA